MKQLLTDFQKWYAGRSKEIQGLIAVLLVSLLEVAIANGLTEIALTEVGIAADAAITISNSVEPLMFLLAFVTFVAWMTDRDLLFRRAIFIFIGLVTFQLAVSIIGLVLTLPVRNGQFGTSSLLRDGLLVWVSNVLVCTIWYWMLDRGGPEKRYWGKQERPDFTFPQQRSQIPGWEKWKPHFADYFFLAFIISTNFSVPDSEVLSRRAKMLVVVQVANSLITLGMVVARAISIIG